MIDVVGVVKRFGKFTAVDNVTFSVKEGEIFALLGPNGAGKSTTIKMLTTLLKPSSGSLTLNGHNVVRDQSAARKSFGIVFQDPSVDVELTALENMHLHGVMYGLPPAAVTARCESLLQLVDLWDRRNSYVKTYSGGMKRRLEIARGLLHQPKVLFLDEPTLGLDTQTRNLLWEYVQRLVKEQRMTVLFTTHYLEEAEANADHIAIIDHGKLLTIGTVASLERETNTHSLEAAYLSLTGTGTRDETSSSGNNWQEIHRARNMK